MANYDVALTSSADKELKKLAGKLVVRILSRVENLGVNPRPSGRLQETEGRRQRVANSSR